MIRDPSDGSVKETPKSAPDLQAPQNTAERLPSSDAARSGADTLIDPTTSGLQTGSTKPEYQARLDKSREWLMDYRMTKALEDIRDNAATMPNGGAWAAGIANLCLATIPGYRANQPTPETAIKDGESE